MKVAVKPLSLAVLGGMLTMAGPAMAETIKLRIVETCLLYTSPSPRDPKISRMPSSA